MNMRPSLTTLIPIGLLTLAGCTHLEPQSTVQTTDTVGDKLLLKAQELVVDEWAATKSLSPDHQSYPPVALAMPASDLWERIRRGYALDRHQHERIDTHLRWFEKHPEYMQRVGERAKPYLYLVTEQIEQRGLPSELALLPIVESAYRPYAYSHGRASGLWQIVPGTGKRFGLKQNWWYDGRRDVLASTEAALKYLTYLNRLFDGDWLLALAAYNSGEGTVRKAVRKNREAGKPTDFWSLDLPRETRAYVPRLLALTEVVANQQALAPQLPVVANTPYLTRVDIGSQLDLDLAAELIGIDRDELYRYNPAFNRWATDPDGPHHLLVPVDKAEAFRVTLKERPPTQRVTWQTHTIRQGESLSEIAKQYHTSAALIRKANRLRGNLIRAGKQLLIPMARTDLDAYSMSTEARRKASQERRHGEIRVDYQVRKGDSLYTIARRHGVAIRELAKWNGMAPRDTLRVGTHLVIWKAAAKQSSAVLPETLPNPVQRNAQMQQKIAYRVRQGDSLARISSRFGVSIEDLRRWNNLHGKRYLQPGQQLTVYVDLSRQQRSL